MDNGRFPRTVASGRSFFFMEWILASASPRRKELFAELVNDFEILLAKGEENAENAPTCRALVETLASAKAREVAALPRAKGKAVLGSDTVVALHGNVMGKPKDETDAKRMLATLSGRTHEVYTGVCISVPCIDGTRKELIRSDCTEVVFEELSEKAIENYVATGSPMDKAGAYGIQDGGLVREIKGSYSNVVGLPLELVKEMLDEIQNLSRR